MGLKDDLNRFREVGEEHREDLKDFIQYGDLGASGPGEINIEIKIVDLPEFAYDQRDQGGVGQGGDADVGDPVAQPQPDDGDAGDEGDESGEPGDEAGEHGYYEMDPEEFAEELDDELGLDLEPKGKKVKEEQEGPFTDTTRTGPDSTLDFERMFKEGLKRKLAMDFDEDYVRAVLQVKDVGPERAFVWAREQNIPVSKPWLEDAYQDLSAAEKTRWESIEEMEAAVEQTGAGEALRQGGVESVPFRREDERYRYPKIVEEYEKNVVVVNIRDVSGSMREQKRELVERVFTPLDWYLQGKYDNAEFVYIAHDTEAWEVDRDEFFGLQSGGGTRISSAYKLVEELLEARYPWDEWNRYVFAAGDSENSRNDTEDEVIPLLREIPANLHAYVETQPDGQAVNATHAEEVEDAFGPESNVAVAYVESPEDVTDAITEILTTEDQ